MRSQTLAPKAQTLAHKAHDPLWSLRVRVGFLLALCAYHSVSESKPPNTPCKRSNVGAESLLHTPKSYCEGRNMELPKRPCRSLLVGEGMIRKELSLNPVGTLAGPLKGVFLTPRSVEFRKMPRRGSFTSSSPPVGSSESHTDFVSVADDLRASSHTADGQNPALPILRNIP